MKFVFVILAILAHSSSGKSSTPLSLLRLSALGGLPGVLGGLPGVLGGLPGGFGGLPGALGAFGGLPGGFGGLPGGFGGLPGGFGGMPGGFGGMPGGFGGMPGPYRVPSPSNRNPMMQQLLVYQLLEKYQEKVLEEIMDPPISVVISAAQLPLVEKVLQDFSRKMLMVAELLHYQLENSP